jgi:methyl-accepting chemotaxis protein
MRRHLPGFKQLANFGISTKLGLIVMVLAIPIGALLFVQYQARQSATSQSQSEANGLDYVSAVMPFLQQVQLHRGLVGRVLAGDEAARANMDQAAAAADDALAAINRADGRWGNEYKTKDLVAQLNSEWPKARDANTNVSESDTLHNAVVEQGILPLISQVAVESKLVLDPNLDSRNMIIALTDTLPKLTEALSQERNTGTALLIARKGQAPTDAARLFIATQSALANFQSAELTRLLETAMAENPRFETDVRQPLNLSTISRSVFSDTTRTEIIDATTLSSTAAEGYFAQGGRAVDLSNQLLTSAQEALNAEFDARASSARSDFALQGTAAFLGVIVALGLALFISASITRPMTHLAEVADRMSLGELDVDIDVEGDNEIGQLAESLRRMQASLRSAIERLRQRRTAA